MSDNKQTAIFNKIRDIIYDESGINFTETNKPILESRLKERLKIVKLTNLDEYFKLISVDKEELKNLLDSVTTNLTKFFRNSVQFDSLENHILDDLKIKKKEKTLRIWSAGCSTGEEPYTAAMVAKEKLDNSWKIEIIASDISFNALLKAKQGYFPKNRIEDVPQKYLKKYFIEIGGDYYIKDEIKNLIQFDYHNLKNEPSIKNFDIVFCRNVIIYFDVIAQKKVINIIYNSMQNYSYLFIGHSESLFGMETKFIFTKIGDACLYMKNEGLQAKI